MQEADTAAAAAAAGADADEAVAAAAVLADPAAAEMQRTLELAGAVLRVVPLLWQLRMEAAVQAR
jgi:hypothetical protein